MEEVLKALAGVLEQRKQGDPRESYVAALYAKGPEAMLKKIGEEATELVLAELARRFGRSGIEEKAARP